MTLRWLILSLSLSFSLSLLHKTIVSSSLPRPFIFVLVLERNKFRAEMLRLRSSGTGASDEKGVGKETKLVRLSAELMEDPTG